MVVREPATGVQFPDDYCTLSDHDCPSLAGVGARSKRVVFKNINVYALGLYVDKKAAKKVLGPKYKGKKPEELSHDQLLCDELIQSNDVPKSMRLVITSGMVNSDRFCSGIRETLGPALEKVGDSASFGEFEGMLKSAPFRKGLELGFSSLPEGGLAALVDSKEVGKIQSPKFTRAFFGLFAGENPVSPPAKRSIQSGLASFVTEE